MILHQSTPCRLSRWALAATAALSLGVVIAPVRSQDRTELPKVEIRVDGKRLDQLNPKQRERVLRELGVTGEALQLVLRAQELDGGSLADAQPEREPGAAPQSRRVRTAKPQPAAPRLQKQPQEPAQPRQQAGRQPVVVEGLDLGNLSEEVQESVRAALEEARQELAADPDLQELGITDEVMGLLDATTGKGDFQSALDQVIGKAMQGAIKMAKKELAADADLQAMGLADGLGKLLDGVAANDDLRQGLLEFAGQAMRGALQEARTEIEQDEDLRELGLTDDVTGMLDDLAEGKLDLDRRLPVLIEKALQHGLRQVPKARSGKQGRERGEDEADDEAAAPAATPAPARKRTLK